MRVRKLLKITTIAVVSLALLILFLVAFFLFNPFEGSLPEMRDVAPRGVDFFIHKAKLGQDFAAGNSEAGTEAFPYIPTLERIGSSPVWQRLKGGSWYKGLGITESLATLRREFVRLRKDLSFLHPVDDLIGREVQIAGRFGPVGVEDAVWCAYMRVSWRGKAAYGAMNQSFVRDEMAGQGIVVSDDSEGFYKLQIEKEGLDLYMARFLDCLMVSNDRAILVESLKLAGGDRRDDEPLGTSGHFKDGVLAPQQEWLGLTGVGKDNLNSIELHLRPDQLFPKLPSLRNWPDPDNEDALNERILASFLNLPSYRFLSGSLIFEPYSISLLSHLVVNNNKLTDFQKGVFEGEATPRSEWMNQFFRMVPRDACGAAALRMPAGPFIREMFHKSLDKVTRSEIDRQIRSTRQRGETGDEIAYKSFDDLVDKLSLSLRPRIGVVLRPNRRSDKFKQEFKTHNESPFPQWTWVFWVKKGRRSDAILNGPLKRLIQHINDNRSAFGITKAFKLGLSGGGVTSDVAYEFAIPIVPGTGSLAAATVGEYFIVGNSAPFIHRMVQALISEDSRFGEPDFKEFVKDMPEAVNGVVFTWAEQLRMVAEDFDKFAQSTTRPPDASFQMEHRGKAESIVFRRADWVQYGTKARIPQSRDAEWQDAVGKELARMWAEKRAVDQIGDEKTRRQFLQMTQAFRSAYLQLVLTETSLRVWGRVLAPEYGRR